MYYWYLYWVVIKGGSRYTGVGTDVEYRLSEEAAAGKKRAKYLGGRGSLQLVFRQKIGNRSQALKAEAAVKKMPKAQKENLIRGQVAPGGRRLTVANHAG